MRPFADVPSALLRCALGASILSLSSCAHHKADVETLERAAEENPKDAASADPKLRPDPTRRPPGVIIPSVTSLPDTYTLDSFEAATPQFIDGSWVQDITVHDDGPAYRFEGWEGDVEDLSVISEFRDGRPKTVRIPVNTSKILHPVFVPTTEFRIKLYDVGGWPDTRDPDSAVSEAFPLHPPAIGYAPIKARPDPFASLGIIESVGVNDLPGVSQDFEDDYWRVYAYDYIRVVKFAYASEDSEAQVAWRMHGEDPNLGALKFGLSARIPTGFSRDQEGLVLVDLLQFLPLPDDWIVEPVLIAKEVHQGRSANVLISACQGFYTSDERFQHGLTLADRGPFPRGGYKINVYRPTALGKVQVGQRVLVLGQLLTPHTTGGAPSTTGWTISRRVREGNIILGVYGDNQINHHMITVNYN